MMIKCSKVSTEMTWLSVISIHANRPRVIDNNLSIQRRSLLTASDPALSQHSAHTHRPAISYNNASDEAQLSHRNRATRLTSFRTGSVETLLPGTFESIKHQFPLFSTTKTLSTVSQTWKFYDVNSRPFHGLYKFC